MSDQTAQIQPPEIQPPAPSTAPANTTNPPDPSAISSTEPHHPIQALQLQNQPPSDDPNQKPSGNLVVAAERSDLKTIARAAKSARPFGCPPSTLLAESLPPFGRFARGSDFDFEENQRQTKIESIRQNSQIPPRYARASLDPRHPSNRLRSGIPADVAEPYARVSNLLRDRCKTFASDSSITLLHGPRGAGKTYLACAALNFAAADCLTIRYVTAMDYFLAIDDAMRGQEPVLTVERKLIGPCVLVVDAMEERADSESKQRMLVRLIDERYKALRSTILVTNEKPEAFAARAGASITDRLQETGSGIIECAWGSLRGAIERREPQRI